MCNITPSVTARLVVCLVSENGLCALFRFGGAARGCHDFLSCDGHVDDDVDNNNNNNNNNNNTITDPNIIVIIIIIIQ